MGRLGSNARQGLWLLLKWRMRDLPREQKSESIEKTDNKRRTTWVIPRLIQHNVVQLRFPLANKSRRSLRSVKVRSVEQPGRLVQQGSPKREQAELLRAICTAPRRGLESEEPVRSQSAIGGKKMVAHFEPALLRMTPRPFASIGREVLVACRSATSPATGRQSPDGDAASGKFSKQLRHSRRNFTLTRDDYRPFQVLSKLF